MKAAGLPINDQKITYRRSKTKIPHNKFIVRLKGGTEPVEVWTGSTNFTASGFLGQTNVGHRVADADDRQEVSRVLGACEDRSRLADARDATAALTPNPAEVIAQKSIARLFSPRAKADDARTGTAADAQCREFACGSPRPSASRQKLVEPIAEKRATRCVSC